MKLALPFPFFDPDRTLFSVDKFEHLTAIFAFVWVISWVIGPLPAFIAGAFVAGAFELGQWDTGRHVPGFHAGPDPATPPIAGDVQTPFLPGFGFGIADLLAGTAGGVLAVLLRLIF